MLSVTTLSVQCTVLNECPTPSACAMLSTTTLNLQCTELLVVHFTECAVYSASSSAECPTATASACELHCECACNAFGHYTESAMYNAASSTLH